MEKSSQHFSMYFRPENRMVHFFWALNHVYIEKNALFRFLKAENPK